MAGARRRRRRRARHRAARRPGLAAADRRAAGEAELAHRVLAHRLGPPAEPAQPAAHGRGRVASPGRSARSPPGQRHRGRGPITSIASARLGAHRDGSSTWVRRHEPQRARCGAAAPSRRPASGPPAPGGIPTASAAGTAGRAGQHPARQVRGRGGGIGAQKHGRPSRSRQPRCPGQACARQGSSCCSLPAPAAAATPTASSPASDIMTTVWPRAWSGDRHRAAPCSPCRRPRKRTPAASPGPACSRRTTPTLFQALRKNGAEQVVIGGAFLCGGASGQLGVLAADLEVAAGLELGYVLVEGGAADAEQPGDRGDASPAG